MFIREGPDIPPNTLSLPMHKLTADHTADRRIGQEPVFPGMPVLISHDIPASVGSQFILQFRLILRQVIPVTPHLGKQRDVRTFFPRPGSCLFPDLQILLKVISRKKLYKRDPDLHLSSFPAISLR